MASQSKVLYIGITSNLQRRVWEHKTKQVSGFSERYNTTRLVHAEEFKNVHDAIAREKQLKKWRREKKVKLIETGNEDWQDLAGDML